MRLRYWILTVLYCGTIFYVSSRERLPQIEMGIDFGDKLLHAAAFALMAGIVSVGIRRSNEIVPAWIQYVVPAAFAIVYGVSDETHQIFVPHRHADALDLLADAVGAVGVQIVLCRLLWRIPFAEVLGGACNPAPPDGIQ